MEKAVVSLWLWASPSRPQGSSMNGAGRVPIFRAALVQTGDSPQPRAALALATPRFASGSRLHVQPKPNEGEKKMTCFYARPYDLSATGFYFETMEDYQEKSAKCLNDFGGQVEEFEIQFIDGSDIDAQLFEAIGINQANIGAFIDKIDEWDDREKQILIIAVGEVSYRFDIYKDDPNGFDVDIYELDSLRDLAIYFVEEGYYGEIPESLQYYIDYDAMARDLSADYSQIAIAGEKIIYRYV
jgi:hypothetical protein